MARFPAPRSTPAAGYDQWIALWPERLASLRPNSISSRMSAGLDSARQSCAIAYTTVQEGDATRHFNFKQPDHLDSAALNRVLWRGMRGEEKPYPPDRERTPSSAAMRSSKARSQIVFSRDSVVGRAMLDLGNLLREGHAYLGPRAIGSSFVGVTRCCYPHKQSTAFIRAIETLPLTIRQCSLRMHNTDRSSVTCVQAPGTTLFRTRSPLKDPGHFWR
jgi:hypothetical protein